VAFDTDAYISGLAATHRLQRDPADTHRAELTRRAVAAELADIKARMNAMHQWSTAVLAEHNREVAQTLGRQPQPPRQKPRARRDATHSGLRLQPAPRAATQARPRQHGDA
jgi:hypothetical protein